MGGLWGVVCGVVWYGTVDLVFRTLIIYLMIIHGSSPSSG